MLSSKQPPGDRLSAHYSIISAKRDHEIRRPFSRTSGNSISFSGFGIGPLLISLADSRCHRKVRKRNTAAGSREGVVYLLAQTDLCCRCCQDAPPRRTGPLQAHRSRSVNLETTRRRRRLSAQYFRYQWRKRVVPPNELHQNGTSSSLTDPLEATSFCNTGSSASWISNLS